MTSKEGDHFISLESLLASSPVSRRERDLGEDYKGLENFYSAFLQREGSSDNASYNHNAIDTAIINAFKNVDNILVTLAERIILNRNKIQIKFSAFMAGTDHIGFIQIQNQSAIVKETAAEYAQYLQDFQSKYLHTYYDNALEIMENELRRKGKRKSKKYTTLIEELHDDLAERYRILQTEVLGLATFSDKMLAEGQHLKRLAQNDMLEIQHHHFLEDIPSILDEIKVDWTDTKKLQKGIGVSKRGKSFIRSLRAMKLPICNDAFTFIQAPNKLGNTLAFCNYTFAKKELAAILAFICAHDQLYRQVYSLVVMECNIDEKDCRSIATAIHSLPCLTTINLRGNKIGNIGITHITTALWETGLTMRLRNLSLEDNYIGPEGALALANCLPHCTHLESLSLAGNPIEDSGFFHILRRCLNPLRKGTHALINQYKHHMKLLNTQAEDYESSTIATNTLTSASLQSNNQTATSAYTSEISVNMPYSNRLNSIMEERDDDDDSDDTGTSSYVDGVHDSDVDGDHHHDRTHFDKKSRAPFGAEVDHHDDDTYTATVTVQNTSTSYNTSVIDKSLILDQMNNHKYYVDITRNVVEEYEEQLKKKDKPKDISDWRGLVNETKEQEESLIRREMKKSLQAQAWRQVPFEKRLSKIRLVLRCVGAFYALSRRGLGLGLLNVSNCGLSSEIAGMILAFLRENRNLTHWILNDNYLGDNFASTIGKQLSMSYVAMMSLRGCGLTDKGVEALARGAGNAPHLTSLELSDNTITSVGAAWIASLSRNFLVDQMRVAHQQSRSKRNPRGPLNNKRMSLVPLGLDKGVPIDDELIELAESYPIDVHDCCYAENPDGHFVEWSILADFLTRRRTQGQALSSAAYKFLRERLLFEKQNNPQTATGMLDIDAQLYGFGIGRSVNEEMVDML